MVTTTAHSIAGQATNLPHTLPTLSTDASILIVMIAIVVYAVVAGFIPLTRLAAGTYIGLVVATNFGTYVYHLTQSGSGAGSSVITVSTIHLALFILPMVLVQIGHPLRSHLHKVNVVFLLILGVLTSLLVISAGLSLLDSSTLQTILIQSNLASQIYNFRLVFIAAVPIAMAVATLFHRPRSHHR